MTGAERTGQDEAAFTGWPRPEPLDARQVFFVRHADHIRRWAALEKDVQASVNRFLTSIVEEVARRDGIPGLEERGVIVHVDADGDWPGISLSRSAWLACGASIRLEWRARRVGLDSRHAPYVGVRLSGTSFTDPAVRQMFATRFAQHDTDSGTATPRWPTWRRIPVDHSFVDPDGVDLAAYRAQLLQALVKSWMSLADIVDELASSVALDGRAGS
jgi:hypothetical protein